MGLLVATAGVIGNARWAKAWGGWAESGALWIGSVGNPSAGKTPSVKLHLGALGRIEAEERQAYLPVLQQYEAKKEIADAANQAWKENVRAMARDGKPPPFKPESATPPEEPSPPRIVIQDATPEATASILHGNPRGILATRDELSGWLGAMDRYNSGGERAFWIEAYGGGSYSVDRKGGRSFTIQRLTASVYGGVQPDKFASLVAAGDDDGLAARFLWTWPEPRPFSRPTRGADDGRIYSALKLLRSLPMQESECGPLPVYVQCSDEAAGILEEFCREQSDAPHYGGNLLRSWKGKGRGHVLRLALALEFLEWSFLGDGPAPHEISEQSMARAAMLYSSYFVPMASRVFGDAALPQAERDAGALAKYIIARRPDAVKVRDIYRERIGGISDPDRAHKAVASLVESGWLIDAATRKGPSPGRRENLYAVNLSLWDALAAAEGAQ